MRRLKNKTALAEGLKGDAGRVLPKLPKSLRFRFRRGDVSAEIFHEGVNTLPSFLDNTSGTTTIEPGLGAWLVVLFYECSRALSNLFDLL
jgi:hypothetical protein